jgi:hydroxyacylglutathione hydrolase
MLKVLTLPSMSVNCYLYVHEETGEGILFDPGEVHPKIEKAVEESGAKIVAIVLTHGHADHILGVPKYRDLYDVPVYASVNEQSILESDRHNYTSQMTRTPLSIEGVHYFEENETLHLAGIDIPTFSTPGHSRGSTCFLLPGGNLLSGDTLFAGSIGRTDLFGGSMKELEHSVMEILYALPDDTVVYPGHGPSTTIGREKRTNAFFRA